MTFKGILQMFVIKSMFLPEACCLSQPININLLLRRSEATQGTEVLCQCLDHTRAQMLSLGPYLHAFLLFYKDLCAGKHSWLERMPLISGFRVTSMFSLIMKAGVISTVWNQRPANGLTRLSPGPHGIRGRRYPQKTPQISADCSARHPLRESVPRMLVWSYAVWGDLCESAAHEHHI